MSDRITLTIPRERPFHRVARLVLGGLAVRLNLTLENLEDLQLALDGLLEQIEEQEGEVTVDVHVDAGRIDVELGPLAPARLRAELERDPADGTVGLGRVLGAVVDDVELIDRRGSQWIRLSKVVSEPAGEVA